MLAATGVSAAGSIASANQQQAADNYNAAVDTANAQQARQASEAQAAVTDQQTRQRLGEQAAAYASGGIDTNTGTPLDVMAQTASRGKLDALTQIYTGNVAANRNTSAAALATMQGDNAATSGLFNAGSTLLTGASTAAKNNPGFFKGLF